MRPADVLPGESWPDGTGNPTFVQKRRLFAGAIDLCLSYVLSTVVLVVFHLTRHPIADPFLGGARVFPPLSGVLFYYIATELAWGRTLGKALFDLKVVAFRGSHIWWRIILRNLTRLLWFFGFPVFLIVDVVLVVATPRSRRWIDMLVGTTVVASPTRWPFSRQSS